MEIFKHNCLRTIANWLKNGRLVVLPTDTVWGLTCHGLDPVAVNRLKQVKGKPVDAKLIWLLPSIQQVQKYCGALTPAETKLLNQKHTTVIIHGQGVRVIKNGWLHRLLNYCQVPLVATSANLHGQPVARSWHQAVRIFDGQIDAVVRGRKIYHDQPSAVVAVIDGQTKILRPAPRISIR